MGREGVAWGWASTTWCTENPSPESPPSSSRVHPGSVPPCAHSGLGWCRGWGKSDEDVYVPGQFLWEVDPGLPAEKAGMQAGDRLVAVAGESVEGLGHEETVARIRAQGSCVSLIVVDPKADRFFSMVRVRGGGWSVGRNGAGLRQREMLQVCSICLLSGSLIPTSLLGEHRGSCLPAGNLLGLSG